MTGEPDIPLRIFPACGVSQSGPSLCLTVHDNQSSSSDKIQPAPSNGASAIASGFADSVKSPISTDFLVKFFIFNWRSKHGNVGNRIGKQAFRPHRRFAAKRCEQARIGPLFEMGCTVARREKWQAMRRRDDKTLVISAPLHDEAAPKRVEGGWRMMAGTARNISHIQFQQVLLPAEWGSAAIVRSGKSRRQMSARGHTRRRRLSASVCPLPLPPESDGWP